MGSSVEPEPIVPVVFRVDSDGHVFALFPTLPETYGVTIFEDVGGHSSGPYAGNVARSKPATPEQYARTLRTLERSYGYRLRVMRRAPRHSR